MVYDFERAAIRGEPVPDGLEPADTWLFLALREVYAQVKKGQLLEKSEEPKSTNLKWNTTS